MSEAILTQPQQKVLELLTPLVLEKKFYLAGGTALALHIGHRRSVDFDFFTQQQFDPSALLTMLPPCAVHQQARGTLTISVHSVRTSFFEFPYPLLEPLQSSKNIPVAHIADIAAMKISAIAGRGSRKDFVDLYIIAKQFYSLQECITFFSKKYETVKTDIYHLMRSLTYFQDAEEETMPEMLIEFDWESAKKFFINEVKKLS